MKELPVTIPTKEWKISLILTNIQERLHKTFTDEIPKETNEDISFGFTTARREWPHKPKMEQLSSEARNFTVAAAAGAVNVATQAATAATTAAATTASVGF